MSGVSCALIAVLASAGVKVTMRASISSGAQPWSTLIFYHFGALVFTLAWLGIPSFDGLTSATLLLVLVSNLIWAVAAILDIKAYETLDASSGEIFGTLTFIITFFAGSLIFQEEFSTIRLIGILIILFGVALETGQCRPTTRRGMGFKLASCGTVALAVILSKYLSLNVPEALVVHSGFFVPGMVYLLLGYRSVPQIIPSIKRSGYKLALVPLLEAVAWIAAVRAYAGTSLSLSQIIFQTCVGVVFLIEYTLLRKRENILRRACACLLCMGGAATACLA